MKRVDLDDLRAKSAACGGKVTTRVIAGPWGGTRLFDVLTEAGGAPVYEGCTMSDAEFAVAAQPSVVMSLVERIRELEHVARQITVPASQRTQNLAIKRMIALLEQGVVLE